MNTVNLTDECLMLMSISLSFLRVNVFR